MSSSHRYFYTDIRKSTIGQEIPGLVGLIEEMRCPLTEKRRLRKQVLDKNDWRTTLKFVFTASHGALDYVADSVSAIKAPSKGKTKREETGSVSGGGGGRRLDRSNIPRLDNVINWTLEEWVQVYTFKDQMLDDFFKLDRPFKMVEDGIADMERPYLKRERRTFNQKVEIKRTTSPDIRRRNTEDSGAIAKKVGTLEELAKSSLNGNKTDQRTNNFLISRYQKHLAEQKEREQKKKMHISLKNVSYATLEARWDVSHLDIIEQQESRRFTEQWARKLHAYMGTSRHGRKDKKDKNNAGSKASASTSVPLSTALSSTTSSSSLSSVDSTILDPHDGKKESNAVSNLPGDDMDDELKPYVAAANNLHNNPMVLRNYFLQAALTKQTSMKHSANPVDHAAAARKILGDLYQRCTAAMKGEMNALDGNHRQYVKDLFEAFTKNNPGAARITRGKFKARAHACGVEDTFVFLVDRMWKSVTTSLFMELKDYQLAVTMTLKDKAESRGQWGYYLFDLDDDGLLSIHDVFTGILLGLDTVFPNDYILMTEALTRKLLYPGDTGTHLLGGGGQQKFGGSGSSSLRAPSTSGNFTHPLYSQSHTSERSGTAPTMSFIGGGLSSASASFPFPPAPASSSSSPSPSSFSSSPFIRPQGRSFSPALPPLDSSSAAAFRLSDDDDHEDDRDTDNNNNNNNNINNDSSSSSNNNSMNVHTRRGRNDSSTSMSSMLQGHTSNLSNYGSRVHSSAESEMSEGSAARAVLQVNGMRQWMTMATRALQAMSHTRGGLQSADNLQKDGIGPSLSSISDRSALGMLASNAGLATTSPANASNVFISPMEFTKLMEERGDKLDAVRLLQMTLIEVDHHVPKDKSKGATSGSSGK